MPIANVTSEPSRIEDLGLLADGQLMRRLALTLLAFGCVLEVTYSLAFHAPDWTDAVATVFVIAACLVMIAIPWKRVSARWIVLPVMLGMTAVTLISVGDGIALGMPFFFLPAAVLMVLFWNDALIKWLVFTPLVATYLIVPMVWGEGDAWIEPITTTPLLIGTSLLLGALFNRFRHASVEEARFRGTITALLMALDARDDHTTAHSSEVLGMVMDVAERLGLDSREQLHVADVALLHDIGKIGIPNEILHKPSGLDAEEWEVMKRHPEIGERILNEVPGFEIVAAAVRHEHERWDGGGYPDGMRGDEIPLASRIVLACDAYHAMISQRPYRAALSDGAAREQLSRNSGSQFDPQVVDAVLATLDRRGREEAVGQQTTGHGDTPVTEAPSVSDATPPAAATAIGPLTRKAASL